jgi:hypothetical protein
VEAISFSKMLVPAYKSSLPWEPQISYLKPRICRNNTAIQRLYRLKLGTLLYKVNCYIHHKILQIIMKCSQKMENTTFNKHCIPWYQQWLDWQNF